MKLFDVQVRGAPATTGKNAMQQVQCSVHRDRRSEQV
jgi:hypothetical protein